MGKKKPSQQCYLCGKWANSYTRDHIPSKTLAGDVPNIQFITVPACLECNQQFSSEESKFRDFLAVVGSNPVTEEANGALEAFKRNIQRNELGRAGRPHKDLQRILNGIHETEFYTPSKIYLGTVPSIRTGPDIDIR